MSEPNNWLKARILAILRGPHVARIEFWLEGLHISGAGLRQVAAAIEQGRIGVAFTCPQQIRAEDAGAYDRRTDDLLIRDGPEMDYSIVHESVHAMVDLQSAKNTLELSDEAAAYIAEVVYRRYRDPQWRAPGGDDIFLAAAAIVNGFGRSVPRLTWSEYAPLREAIRRVYYPRTPRDQVWLRPSGADGVPARRLHGPIGCR
ncbi:MAG: hypothetical protein HY820_38530 [Acidobacteria bacterium]|nr:hypothetical protein [Acidobacteriota bacterium]